MQHSKILTHQIGKTYQMPHFFILNKGINSGKPLKQSCPNCFVFMLLSEKEKEFTYWLVYGLWRAKVFHSYLKGSVVLFITINDLKGRIMLAKEQAEENLPQFEYSIQSLKKLEALEEQYLLNLKLIQEAKRVVFYRYIKRRT